MRVLRLLVLGFVTVFVAISAMAQGAASEAQAIRGVLEKQVVDWNRGDIEAFATTYKNSPDILFMGSRMNRGYAQMLEGYRKAYPTREKMGTLKFTELEVQPLDERFATTTGRFHLERSVAAGGNVDGFFLLVLEKTPEGWKIVRDDTTVPAKSAGR